MDELKEENSVVIAGDRGELGGLTRRVKGWAGLGWGRRGGGQTQG